MPKKLEEVGFKLLMKNPVIFYGAIALGVIALVVGIFFLMHGFHGRSYGVLAVGAILLIGGIVGMMMTRSKAMAR